MHTSFPALQCCRYSNVNGIIVLQLRYLWCLLFFHPCDNVTMIWAIFGNEACDFVGICYVIGPYIYIYIYNFVWFWIGESLRHSASTRPHSAGRLARDAIHTLLKNLIRRSAQLRLTSLGMSDWPCLVTELYSYQRCTFSDNTDKHIGSCYILDMPVCIVVILGYMCVCTQLCFQKRSHHYIPQTIVGCDYLSITASDSRNDPITVKRWSDH